MNACLKTKGEIFFSLFACCIVVLVVIYSGRNRAQEDIAISASADELNAQVFARVVPGKTFHFPEDHALHHDFQSEWWYLTANLRDQQGNQFGIQFTLFAAAGIADKKIQRVYFAHAALSSEEHFYFAERYAREDMGHAGVQQNPWAAYIDHWRLEGTGGEPFPGRINVKEENFSFDLLTSDADYFLQGDNGYNQKNSSGTLASYYYSAPFVTVKGQLSLAGEIHTVAGQAWLDREWSTSVIRAGNRGWDWFALHLDENTALMLYRLRSEGADYFYGNLMAKNGAMISLTNQEVTFKAMKSKEFNDQDYTLVWQISIPSQNIDIITMPINDQQFLRTRIPYWEGAITTTGTHQAVGYMELFGKR
jgi:predicted secreted hydrolase